MMKDQVLRDRHTPYHLSKGLSQPSTMSTPLVALILGSGPRIGAAVATKLIGNGYHVAIVSRKGETGGIKGVLALQADFAEQWDVAAVYDAVEAEFQAPPSVVIYNAAALTPPATPTSLLSIPAEKFRSDLSVNAISPYLAAQEAVRRWEAMPDKTQKTFIYTGNAQNVLTIPVPAMLNLGVGKSASAYWIGAADGFYSSKGYR